MKENEIYGEGNTYSAEYWMYDSRLGRRWNVDPVKKHHESSYAAFANNPVWFVDPDGRDSLVFYQWMDSEGDVQLNQTYYVDDNPGLVTYGYDEINDETVHEYTPPVEVTAQAKPEDNTTEERKQNTLELSTFQSIGYAMDMFYASITLPTPVTESESSADAVANKYFGYPLGLAIYETATFFAPLIYIETAAVVVDDKMTGQGYQNTGKNLLMYSIPSKGKALPFSIFIQGLDYTIKMQDFYENHSSRYDYVEQ